ncbi:LuxR C-terminal-related transcriptional regulator [Kitasatospora sp. NBC_00374]|uniref:helix-turn-helix transcriptional regulator n=1 Tax=Kitasatospora sp. NBC_00374 TaxID=2975964 RepID=UPI00352C9418
MAAGGTRVWVLVPPRTTVTTRGTSVTIRQLADTVGPHTGVPVTVHAVDPISRAGAASQLRRCPGLFVTEDPDPEAATDGTARPAVGAALPAVAAVVVLVAETVDATVSTALRRLGREDGRSVVLVVDRIREAELLEAVEGGVAAILWRREATAERLGQAVLAAARGHGDLPADLLGRLIKQLGRSRRGSRGVPGFTPSGISDRESDILRLVADGWDTGEIAGELSYSERTVKNVLHGLTTRLNLRNRAHAVAHALREGYI